MYRRRVPFDRLLTPELTRSLAEATHLTGRQIGVLVDRAGNVEFVIVGDASKLMLPDLGRLRAAEGRFRGLRLIHTHLRQEPLTRDDLVDLTRLRLDMIAALCVHEGGQPGHVYYGHCVPSTDAHELPYVTHGPIPLHQLDCNPERILGELEEAFARAARLRRVHAQEGRAILVQVHTRQQRRDPEDSLHELRELARTAGVQVADCVSQFRDQVNPKYVLGRGKLDDVVLRAMQLDADLLIFDHDLTAAQASSIAAITDLRVIDRTQLILDIFARRAESGDGKLQVELAQMRYLLPRLGMRDDALSRLTGGIGGRGPGETKLEIGRRRARERIHHLETQLHKLSKQREQRRAKRNRESLPIVAIVGYTNAGKSTLLNTLTRSNVVAENKLFATLDTRSRRLRFPDERDIIITDTVGFIRDLPKALFAAFRATFEEAQDADLLLQVVDAADPALDAHMQTTESLLVELELHKIPRLIVYNKSDRITSTEQLERLSRQPNSVVVSSLQPETLGPLLHHMQAMLTHGDAASPPIQPNPNA
jgi:GTP-binding protein HflX